jgi:signal transduction histidine kinase
MVNFQNRYITKKGKIIWLEWTSVYLPQRELVFAIAKNITARKEMEHHVLEEFVKLKQRATEFKSELEKERKYVAAELHEDLAQLAAAVKVDLDWISSNVNVPAETKKRIDHALVSADMLVDTIRRISFSISPGMLDDVGLDATLEWYCSEFSASNGVDCSFNSSYDEAVLSKEVRLDFFRICQQVLSNITEQAHADKVKINITQKAGKVVLTIDGVKGDKMAAPGVMSIHERAASFGGKCIVEDNRVLVTT